MPIELSDTKSSTTAGIINNNMYIFGGYDSNMEADNKLYTLNLETRSWSKINNNNTPPPRYSHTLVVNNKKLYIFGGYN